MRRCPLILMLLVPLVGLEEWINQEGRILGPVPVVTTPLLFNTAAADAILSAMQIMPVDNEWNEDVSALPLLPNSAEMVGNLLAILCAESAVAPVVDTGTLYD